MKRQTIHSALSKHALCFLLLASLLFISIASAYTVPQKIPVQGRLSNASTGVVLSGEYNFTFRIYNTSTSGTLLWDENQTLAVDGNGLWNALLGNNTTLSLNFSEDTYLEVELNHDGTPLPRVQLGTTPYAEWTDTAANLSCTDCLGTTEIEDVYLLNTGDNATGNYMFNGTFKVENSSGSVVLYVNASNGNVGIGTTSPVYPLQVEGSDGILINATTNHLRLQETDAEGAGKEWYIYQKAGDLRFYDTLDRLVVQNTSGNVGIGTTSPAHDLHINESSGAGSAYIEGNTGNAALYLDSGGDNQDSRLYFYDDGVGKWLINYEEPLGNLEIYDYGSGSDVFAIQNGTGYVGIGTTSPSYLLDVNGNVQIGTYAGTSRTLRLSDSLQMIYAGSNLYATIIGPENRVLRIDIPGNDGTDGLYIRGSQDSGSTYPNDVLFASAAGNIGIGTTSPSYHLDIRGGSAGGSVLYAEGNNLNNGSGSVMAFRGDAYNGLLSIKNKVGAYDTAFNLINDDESDRRYSLVIDNSDSTKLKINTDTNNAFTTIAGTNLLTITTSGNVGIGTTNPYNLLSLQGSLTGAARWMLSLNNTDSSTSQLVGISITANDATGTIITTGTGYTVESDWAGGTYLHNSGANGHVGLIAPGANGYLDFITGSNTGERMRITSSGNVGIGTTSPGQALDVVGNEAGDYVASFHNDGNNANRYGVMILAGTDDNSGTNYHMSFQDGDGTGIGFITSSGGTVTYGAFTANHDASVPEEFNEQGYPYGTVVCITGTVDDPERPKQVDYLVAACNKPYDKKVFGVYSGKYADKVNLHSIFALGDGHILVTEEGGNIEVGDYLTSSGREGHAMKQDDDILHSYTVAKATQDVDWSVEESDSKLISCTYHSA